jgi:hypothetical protein
MCIIETAAQINEKGEKFDKLELLRLDLTELTEGSFDRDIKDEGTFSQGFRRLSNQPFTLAYYNPTPAYTVGHDSFCEKQDKLA